MFVEPIRHAYVLRCSPERAFDAYANHIGEWWPGTYTADASTFVGVRIEGRVDGAVTESHEGGQTFQWGEVTAWEPGARLSYTSTLAQDLGSPSEITVTFTPHPVGCRVEFEHGGWNEQNASDRRKFGDWPLILAGFVEVAERMPPTAEVGAATQR